MGVEREPDGGIPLDSNGLQLLPPHHLCRRSPPGPRAKTSSRVLPPPHAAGGPASGLATSKQKLSMFTLDEAASPNRASSEFESRRSEVAVFLRSERTWLRQAAGRRSLSQWRGRWTGPRLAPCRSSARRSGREPARRDRSAFPGRCFPQGSALRDRGHAARIG